MNSYDEIQIEEDAAYHEWLWRQEMEIREDLDEANLDLQEAALECTF